MSRWVTKGLFCISIAIATLLLLLVVIAPIVDSGEPVTEGFVRVLALFARDSAVRRTGFVAAIGLYATAAVFFRPDSLSLGASSTERHGPFRRYRHSR